MAKTDGNMSTRPHVFIQTNDKQSIGALVSAHSLKRNSAHPDQFDVMIMRQEDYPFFRAKEGQAFLRHGVRRLWRNDDLQSFTLLRFMPPALMGYRGRALVIDPDVFAVGDVWELLSRDMGGKAILCRHLKHRKNAFATSVMLLDCAKLTHWNVEREFDELLAMKRDYNDWISLKLEPPGTIGAFEDEWNDFDRLTDKTKLLHNTKRRTQPWKTGLPVDYTPTEIYPVIGAIMRMRRKLFGDYGLLGRYARHPDPRQENLFFGLLRECVEKGTVPESALRTAMAHNHVRHDALDVIARVPPLAAKPAS